MRNEKFFLAVSLLLAIVSTNVLADDLIPPPWRGHPGSTMQLWEFNTPNPNPVPDIVMNPFGPPVTHVMPGVGQQYWPIWGQHPGVWPLSGTMTVDIPNSHIPNPVKEIWIQLTWAQQAPGNEPLIKEAITGVPAKLIQRLPMGPTGEPFGDGMWWHSVYVISLFPNPPFETVRIDGGIMVDELVIDTICIPEPATLAMLGLGALAFIRKR